MPKWTPTWDPTSLKTLPWAAQGPPPRDANGRPEASIKLFWSLLEQMFVPPGSNYGTIWVSFGHFHHSSFFPCSGPRFGCIPANQGRRVPALALTIFHLKKCSGGTRVIFANTGTPHLHKRAPRKGMCVALAGNRC